MENKIYNQVFDQITVSNAKSLEIERNLHQANSKMKKPRHIALKFIVPIAAIFILSIATVSATGIIDLGKLFETSFQSIFVTTNPFSKTELDLIKENGVSINQSFTKDGVTITFPGAIGDSTNILMPYSVKTNEKFNDNTLDAILSARWYVGTESDPLQKQLGRSKKSNEKIIKNEFGGTLWLTNEDEFQKNPLITMVLRNSNDRFSFSLPYKNNEKAIKLKQPIKVHDLTIQTMSVSSLSASLSGVFPIDSGSLQENELTILLKDGKKITPTAKTGHFSSQSDQEYFFSHSFVFATPISTENIKSILITKCEQQVEIPIQ